MKVNFACEGKSDLPFLVSMIRATGNEVGEKIVKRGCVNLDNAIPQYAQAASYFPGELWLIVRDADGQCPVELRERLNPVGVPDTFLLRIAVNMIESWMLADEDAAENFFGVSKGIIQSARNAKDPKRALLNACQHGKYKKRFKDRLFNSSGNAGPEFIPIYEEFAVKHWDANRARKCDESLDRAMRALEAHVSF